MQVELLLGTLQAAAGQAGRQVRGGPDQHLQPVQPLLQRLQPLERGPPTQVQPQGKEQPDVPAVRERGRRDQVAEPGGG